jgi:hypothetical protein
MVSQHLSVRADRSTEHRFLDMDQQARCWPSLPFLSAADEKTEAEGSIDPLGLVPIAERLANELVPGVRERHNHPRYLTAMAVGLRICEDLPADQLAADGHSPPYQVYEWYAVEGLVRMAEKLDQRDAIRGLPGQMKARAAAQRSVPLAAATYLKVPSVFGFHGVYRRLAEAVGVLDKGGLRELGEELLETWAVEQDLPGFNRIGKGTGEKIRRELAAAVTDGFAKGEVARGPRWGGWSFFFDHLRPFALGRRERELLWRALATPENDTRARVLAFLASGSGHQALREADRDGEVSERIFHAHLRRAVEPELVRLLDAIDAYERFCRLIHNAFYACLGYSAGYPHPISTSELAETDAVKVAARDARRAFEHAEAQLEPKQQDQTFRETFGALTETANPAAFVDALLDHHRKTQRRKPPDGKAPWFELYADGRVMARPQYRDREAVTGSDEYVGLYRTRALCSMAADLARLPQ